MNKNTERLSYLIKNAKEKYAAENLVLVVPAFIGKKFIGYCAMKEDLELLLKYITELRQDISPLYKSAFTSALIALYGKCFTDASKASYPKLEPSDVFGLSNEHSETHDYLMELRHKFIAHRGDSDGEIGISYVLIPKNECEQSQVYFSQVKLGSFTNDELDKIEALVKFLLEQLPEKIQKNGQKVRDSMLSNFSPEQLQFMMINNVQE